MVMSEQVEFLKQVLSRARAGDDAAAALLRQICQAAVEAAPLHALVTVAECLCRVAEAT
jgi:hypothetical protein